MTEDLEIYLHTHIPISAAMGVRVLCATTEEVRLKAPLQPNINHFSKAFGGSEATLATLAAWSWLHLQLRIDRSINIVIRRSVVDFHIPVPGDFEAVCKGNSLDELKASLRRRNRGRVDLTAEIQFEGSKAATFVGTFVALKDDKLP